MVTLLRKLFFLFSQLIDFSLPVSGFVIVLLYFFICDVSPLFIFLRLDVFCRLNDPHGWGVIHLSCLGEVRERLSFSEDGFEFFVIGLLLMF